MRRCTIEGSDIKLAYSVARVERLDDLREDLDELVRSGRMSAHEVFREYLTGLTFDVPESLPDARSIVVVAMPTPLMWVTFHLEDASYDLMVPPQYYRPGTTSASLRNTVVNEIIGVPDCGVEQSHTLQQKPLAVKSGLARYGRNNICYVDGMGSLLTLYTYFTDVALDEDSWGEVRFMEACASCRLCLESCPCGCIDAGNTVVNVGKCVTLHNEIAGEFPVSLPNDAHNALMGCMRCQLCCPANREVIGEAGRLEDISEEETRRILEGTPDQELMESLSRKLRGFPPAGSEELFPILTRNLRALL